MAEEHVVRRVLITSASKTEALRRSGHEPLKLAGVAVERKSDCQEL